MVSSPTEAVVSVAQKSLFSEGFSFSVMGNKPVNKCVCHTGITQAGERAETEGDGTLGTALQEGFWEVVTLE